MGLRLGIDIGDWDWGLGLWIGIGDWDWGMGLGIRIEGHAEDSIEAWVVEFCCVGGSGEHVACLIQCEICIR